MSVIISIIWWLIFGLIPTIIVLIPAFFVLKANSITRYWWYFSVSISIGFIVYFFIGSIPFFVGQLESASIDHVEMVKAGSPTIAWYLAKFEHSAIGAVASAVVGSTWWFALVRPRNA